MGRRRRASMGLALLGAMGATLGAGARPLEADEEIRPAWMKLDAGRKVVQLTLVAAADGGNGTMNWNGYGNGDMTVTIPPGWKVEIELQNRGVRALPHRLVVIDDVKPLPVEGGKPAFPRAVTRRLVQGMMPPEIDSLDFTASREGRFLIFCGVTGHGAAGMWDYLVVSKDATAPGVQVRKK